MVVPTHQQQDTNNFTTSQLRKMSPSQISKFSTSNYQTSKLAFEANMSAAGALDSDLNALKSNLQAATVLFAGISAPLLLYLFKDNIRRSEIIYRLLWVGAFALNLITVSIGGRFDSDQVSQSGAFFWKTLFVPAGYAFAIWGIIYLSEIFLTAYVGVVGQPSSLLKKAVPFWTLANVFQSLWCFVFRPKYLNSLWLPTSQLAFGAVSLSFAHQALSQALIAESNWIAKLQLFVLRFPITLHTGWLTAASLLNLNSWAAVSKLSVGSQATVAFASA